MFRVGAEAERRVLTELQYSEALLVQEDLKKVRSKFSDLRLYCDVYCFPNKQRRRLVFLAGTITVNYQGSGYNLPVCLWLHQTHPKARPRCCVCPSVSMAINPHCRYVDAHGNVLLPRLQAWTQDCSLLTLVSEMKQAFEKDTPLYSRPLPPPRTTRPAGGDSPCRTQKQKHSYCEDLKDIDFSPAHRPGPAPCPGPAPSCQTTSPAPSDVTDAMATLRLSSSSQSERREVNTGQSERKEVNTGQSERREVNTGQSERREVNTGQSERRELTSGQSERREHTSGQSERREHTSSQSGLSPDRNPALSPEEEQLKLQMSALPPHKLHMFLQLLRGRSQGTEGRGQGTEGRGQGTEGRGYSTAELLEAVRLNEDLASAQRFLHHLCPVCQEHRSFSKMVLMTHCCCALCQSCFKSWFSSVIREKSVESFVCPLCQKPDFREDPDLDLDYFSLLDTQIRHFLSPELHDLFQRKLRDRALSHMTHFCWCSHCSFGFLHESSSLRMDCPSCYKSTCSHCRSAWSSEHEGVSCEDFRVRTQTRTGPQFNCIECPECLELYSGSKGGCLHFCCPRCGTNFCGGCSARFYQGQNCPASSSCSSRGFHAHHPRDCVYHLRDWSLNRLHLLLQFYRVSPSWIQAANQSTDSAPSGLCPVLELRDSETPCGKPAPPEEYRGYCRSHYIERIVWLLNAVGADPLVLFSLEEAESELRRWNQAPPTRAPSEGELQYCARITQVVLQKIPLRRRSQKSTATLRTTRISAPPEPGLNQD